MSAPENGACSLPSGAGALSNLGWTCASSCQAGSRLLGAARDGLVAIGGSHAQRDLFEQAYVESLIRSGSHERAERVLNERLALLGGTNLFASQRLAKLHGRAPGRLAALATTSARDSQLAFDAKSEFSPNR